jgi:hypothetical protein
MLLAQVWIGYPTKFSFQHYFCNLIEFFMTKNCSNFNIFNTLGLKIFKSLSLNPTYWRFSKNIKSMPRFPNNFLFWFKWFRMKNYSIFNSVSTIGQNIMKPTWCASLIIKGFPMIIWVWQEAIWLGRFQDYKWNKKKATFFHR